ncbi:MAG TPA: hypothetical protein VEB19_14795 [Gemmatimonadaceae bacterium]|nr:hypothetical protein [Gemmatimonadaceae bacterium]
MAVLVLALITAAVVAGYSSINAEVVSNNAMRAQQRAYQLAEIGLQQFLLRRNETGFCTNCVADPAVADSEWTRVNLIGGYADIVAMRVRGRMPDGTPALFFVRSRGVDTTARLSGAGRGTNATRTVGQYATFGTSSVKPLAALTTLNGFTNSVQGSRIPVLGQNGCNFFNVIGGVVIPSGGNYAGSGTLPLGFPPVDSSMSRDSLKKRVGVDWPAIIKDNAIPADITIPGDPWPSFNDPNYWPVIRIKRGYSVPTDGRGLIIADSNLTFTTNDTWDGIVLVGGNLTVSGSGSLDGVYVSGLNHMLPTGGPMTRDIINNTKRIQFNSCNALSASSRLKTYFVWTNTWLDNVNAW